jgi:DNA-binding beta-propeller fold protein YncE
MADKAQYQVLEGWEQLPADFMHRDVSGLGVDSLDRVYVLTRSQPRVIIYNRDGSFVASFGEGLFTERTHGLAIGSDDSVYCVDDGDQTVRKFSPAGDLLLTIGIKGVASDTGYNDKLPSSRDKLLSIKRGGPPFNRPTNVAIAPNGDLYVSDGYGNCRVHRFAADGKLIQSWGEPGVGPGEFHLPHGIAIAADGRVLVADRENDRIQIFTPTGEYLSQWINVQRPTDIFIDRAGIVFVGELQWRPGQDSFTHGPISKLLPGRVSILDLAGNVLERLGGPEGCAPGSFWAPHAICTDSRGDLYVGEVVYSFSGLGKAGIVPAGCHTLQKFTKAG